MKEYITFGAIAVALLGTAAIVGLDSKNPVRDPETGIDRSLAACPTSRAQIEASLHTTKADGMYYRVTRKSVRTPIREVIVRMHGRAQARKSAESTRDFAKQKLAAGVTGTEKRFYMDTILRSEALLAILDCMEKKPAL